MTGVRITEANEQDVEKFVRDEDDRDFFLDRLRRRGAQGGRVFLAIDGDRAVGYVYLRLETAEELKLRLLLNKAPLLERLRVERENRLQGIGRMLVTMAEATAWVHRRRQVALGVVVARKPKSPVPTSPIGFYRKLGYSEWRFGRIKTYKDGRKSEIEYCRVFVKKLTPPTA
ncbi:GNAT family N-acetyltransferase [Actinoplanes sp. LDG1-06]|uniref:GNAT family N-acetyltransferase n=1 Tax=Paractinoplanes ovalisporus TaxID=2810368 RepID=A0ABS2AUS2_9ACTN|nr:GNAT family N-acetyltransferase [Actinoplanes ovalisporus]MBM2623108.1 GNAT family N-acetyltransferase [Actinoplanes ovalisporus]